jgi:16S rRNA (guanine(1405)-N(7))-methyltransferase
MSRRRPVTEQEAAQTLETVIGRLAAAPKYRDIHPDTVAEVVRREAQSTHEAAELERRARARLHKVAALHLLTTRPAALRRAVRQADPGPEGLRAWCREMLAGHASTAERLPDLDAFYPAILALVPAPRTVVDIACALNPFTVPWLREATGAQYVGYDLNAQFVEIGNAFLSQAFPDCRVEYEDVLTKATPVQADLALLLKTYHCIEDRQPGAALHLVDRLAVDHVVVSFPTRALNGRSAVFARRHVEELTDLADRRSWRLSRATLPTEEFVAISKV